MSLKWFRNVIERTHCLPLWTFFHSRSSDKNEYDIQQLVVLQTFYLIYVFRNQLNIFIDIHKQYYLSNFSFSHNVFEKGLYRGYV